ncbi:hypothetical protein [Methylococcus sp. EFPC2]|uniref:hypothetical protein n=1 Tax=Methylococcus sp. EFPC2 TaxID=2812648 RepID=UPI001967649B|nr:hypothetical protein [Methylococcus sp. EFPC2]QSA98403.1 hypothetical protein JWZ97_06235 [Methylococcus sp. EFPC2]
MARFRINEPITTREPSIVVDAGLDAGVHRFQLEVLDAAGNRSVADIVAVQIQRPVVTNPAPTLRSTSNPEPSPTDAVPTAPTAPVNTRGTTRRTRTSRVRNRNPNPE